VEATLGYDSCVHPVGVGEGEHRSAAPPTGHAPRDRAGDSARGDGSRGEATRPVEAEGHWQRAARSGTLRASIFGVNDGLVSNLALVMGIIGANADGHLVALTGIAGLLAGSFSMAAGEWISMASQRELFQRRIGLEREALRTNPEEERRAIARIYERKGIPAAEARGVADRLMTDPETALDTKVREELGLDPDSLGSPSGAAAGSFLAFALGAFVPVAPFLVTRGTPAIAAAIVLAFVALFLVGAAVSRLTGRGLVRSGARQVLIGAGAAVVVFLVGSFIGVQVR
jgi:vacuolar iron transporter family protein